MPVPFENKTTSFYNYTCTDDDMTNFFADSYDRFLSIPDNVAEAQQPSISKGRKKRTRQSSDSDSNDDSDSDVEPKPTKGKVQKKAPAAKKPAVSSKSTKAAKVNYTLTTKSMKDLMGYDGYDVEDYVDNDEEEDPYTIHYM